MSLAYTADAFGIVIALGLAALAGLGVVWLVGRVLLAMTGGNRSWTPAVVVAMLVGAALTLSLALDTIGTRTRAVVTSRRETASVTRRGGWNRTTQLGLRTTGSGVEQFLTLSPSFERYDALVEGDTVDLRTLTIFRGVSLVRDAQQNSRTWLPWGWLFVGIGGAAAAFLAWKVSPTLVVVIAIVVGLGWPIVSAWRDDAAANDSAARTAHATATVRAVTRVTEWHLGSRRSSRWSRAFDEYVLAQPYDVVTLEFTPPGALGSVLAVDAVDVAADAPPVAKADARMSVRFAAEHPRDAQLEGFTRRWHWRDMAGVYRESVLVLAVFVAGLLALSWGWSRITRALKQAAGRR